MDNLRRKAEKKPKPDHQQLLAEAESKVHLVTSVVENGFSAVLIADSDLPDPKVMYINPAFSRLTGWTLEQAVGQRISRIPQVAPVQARLAAGIEPNEPFVEGLTCYKDAGGERWGEWRVGPVVHPGGSPSNWLVILRDITERKRLEKEILEIRDRERQRLGQDLHDGLCQHLAAIELMSQLLEQKLAGRSREGAARAGEIAAQVREAINYTRLLARGLSPVTLEREGLTSALSELAANTEKMFGVHCSMVSDVPVAVRNPAAAIHIYRIAQEAVSNALRHGKARHVTITLNKAGHDSVLTVSDDGRGLPPEMPTSGMGLRIMQHRASILGGHLIVRNGTATGAEVVFTFPSNPFPGTQSFNREH